MARRTRRIAILAGLGATGAAGALTVAIISGPALADPTPNPSSSTSAQPDRDAERTQRRNELAAALAAELGIDQAKVTVALEKVQAAQEAERRAEGIADLKTRLDTAVAEGKLTAEQATAILAAAQAGVLPGGGHRGPGALPGR